MSEALTSSPDAVSRDAVVHYLRALYAHAPKRSFVELRYRTLNAMRQTFHPACELDAISAEIITRAPASDVYLGVIPRRRRGGGRDDLVSEARVLWVDCDTPEAVAALRATSPRPSIAVASGTGENTHAYWLLSEPTALADIEQGNRCLAARLAADPVCADAARILRPPSLNHKYRPPAVVRLENCEPDRRHLIEHVVGKLAADRSRCRDRHAVLDPDDPLRSISPIVYIERLARIAVPRHRKIRCPFHDDRTPSLHVYRDSGRGWYCFGCNRGGSIYDFAAHLWDLDNNGASFDELQDRLCTIFGPDDRELEE